MVDWDRYHKLPRDAVSRVAGQQAPEDPNTSSEIFQYDPHCGCQWCKALRNASDETLADAGITAAVNGTASPHSLLPSSELQAPPTPPTRIVDAIGDQGKVMVVKGPRVELTDVYQASSGRVKRSDTVPPSAELPPGKRPSYRVFARFTRSQDEQGRYYYLLNRVYVGEGANPWMHIGRPSKGGAAAEAGATHQVCTTAVNTNTGRLYRQAEIQQEMERIAAACQDACLSDMGAAAERAGGASTSASMYSRSERDAFVNAYRTAKKLVNDEKMEQRGWVVSA